MKKLLSILFGLFVACSFYVGNVDYTFAAWASDVWINFQWDCLYKMWKWCFDYEKMIWIDTAQTSKPDATTMAQDLILASTYIVWAVLTLVVIICGLWFIFAARSGASSKASKYKDWLIYAMIWAVLVWWAYAIVRLIQYVARW